MDNLKGLSVTVKEFPALTKLVDEGICERVHGEIERYNNDRPERYPLSPSQIGKCALALARNLAHYHGVVKYPRRVESLPPRLYRIFRRGNLLEEAMVADFEEYAGIKLKLRQQRLHLFDVVYNSGPKAPMMTEEEFVQAIEGDIDGLVVHEQSGLRILVDYKSKGVRYSAGFNDSLSEMFAEMIQTGLVEDKGDNLYFVNDINQLINLWSADDFFMDYMLQLNSYAFSDWFRRNPVHAVSLYYENKNTCANYEVRWVPDRRPFDWARNKFQHIFSTVFTSGPEAVQREFNAGSTKCFLCEYNEQCNGKFDKTSQRVVGNIEAVGVKPEEYKEYTDTINAQRRKEKLEMKILAAMEQKGLTFIQMPDGLTYERKFLKTPKPHHELRLTRNDK
jgi:hypothetical protein